MTTKRMYTTTQQALHWIAAIAILAMFPMGYVMARSDSDTLRTTLYGVHGAIGGLIVVIAIVRIVLSRRNHVPPPAGLPRWNRVVRATVHRFALYLPLLLAVTGIGTMVQNDLWPILQSGGAQTIPATLDEAGAQSGHQALAWIYLAVLAAHVAGVLRHQLSKDDVLSRMGVTLFANRGARHPAADR